MGAAYDIDLKGVSDHSRQCNLECGRALQALIQNSLDIYRY